MRISMLVRWILLFLSAMTLSGAGPRVPFAVRITSPEYPVLAQQARIAGTVVIRVRINIDGTVANADAVTGHPLLRKAAEQNIKLWRFAKPGENASGDDLEFSYTYVFQLKGVSSESHPSAELTYEYPDKVTVTSKAPHWQP
jgi:TonB family protein